MSDSYLGNKTQQALYDAYSKAQADRLFKNNGYSLFTTSFNLAVNSNHLIDTTTTAITATLPANPVANDSVEIIDIGGNMAVNNLTVNRNGKPIMSLAEDLTASEDFIKIRLTFVDDTYGWVLT